MAVVSIPTNSTTPVESVFGVSTQTSAPTTMQDVPSMGVDVADGSPGELKIELKPIDCDGTIDVEIWVDSKLEASGTINNPSGKKLTLSLVDTGSCPDIRCKWKANTTGAHINASGALALWVQALDW